MLRFTLQCPRACATLAALMSTSVFAQSPFPEPSLADTEAVARKTPIVISLPPASETTWTGYTTSFFGKQAATLVISVTDGKVTGTVSGPKESFPVTGSQSGPNMVLTCMTHDGLQTMTLRGDANTLQGQWKAGAFSGNMVLTKQ